MFTDSQIRYLSRESFGVFWRMKGMSLVSTLIMSVSLMMLALFTLATLNLRELARSFRNQIEINVFVKDSVPEWQVQELRQRLEAMDGVASVTYVSKEEALEEFRAQLGPDSDLLAV